MTRAHIRITTNKEIKDFISDASDFYHSEKEMLAIQDGTGRYQVDAGSLLGVIYASCEYNDTMYLVNLTNDGHFTSVFDKYRVLD